MECKTDLFIDIQGYNCSFGYIPKELAIYDGLRCSNYLFKSPFQQNMLSTVDIKMVSWAEEYHGIDWNAGNIELNEIDSILKHVLEIYQSPKIYVKGNEKIKYLKKFINEDIIYPIPIGEEPKLSRFKKIPECYFHKNVNPWHCALANVKLLYNYKDCYDV